ncbi:MAG TPA: aldo/keto reductase [Tepidisphaeraceae bacterium]|jgi:L-glyceraldehyde 3-phosphate reductase|nr:aldo/keto reductase [Tepidisphaeraceae bacterium]
MSYQPAADRYKSLPNPEWFRRCGKSGLKLPAISLGCWHNFGGVGTDSGKHTDEASFHDNCRQMLFTAFDHGITHFDLANNYGPPAGSAEERVGRILNDDFKAQRDELIIATKAGYGMWAGPYGDFGSRKYLLSSLDASLKRLKLDYVDIFYHHRPDPNTPLDETMGALDQAVKSGKAIYAAISNYRGGLTAEALGVCKENGFAKPILHQPNYNMFDRWIENDLLPVTERLGLGTIVFSPMAQGMLSDKYLNGIPAHSRATAEGGFLRPSHVTDAKLAKIRKLNDLAKQRGQSLAQMALVWTLRKPAVTSALIGASRPEQITENIAALKNASFSEDELKQIETILAS